MTAHKYPSWDGNGFDVDTMELRAHDDDDTHDEF